MTSTSKKRIMLDIKLLKEMDVNLEVLSLNNIQCNIKGPKDTPYENGKWKLTITFPEKYPYKSPSIGFLDAIYHPNIDLKSGTICLNVLNEEWQPIYTLKHILETFIPQLLTYPNPDDPLNIEAAEMYKSDYEKFKKCVTDFIKKQNDFHKK